MTLSSPLPGVAPTPGDLKRYRANLQGEIDGAALYRAMVDAEANLSLKEFYRRLAETETRHGAVWREYLEAAGISTAGLGPSWRARILMLISRRFGSAVIVATIAGRESSDQAMYDSQPEATATMPADERSHARLFRELSGGRGLEGGVLARIEGRHKASGGNALRAAVLGANDGLVSNLSLSMGVAGASGGGGAVLVAGVAGLLAGSLSMALGEWLSVQSARELYAHQVTVEREELAMVPDEEEEELALIYESKGLSPEQSRATARSIIGGDVGRAVDTLAREELGIDPEALGGSAWVAAGTSFCLFALGAIVPVAPFIVASGFPAVVASIILSAIALMAVGVAITIVTGSSALRSGGRQVIFGMLAAAVTFGLGSLVGTAVHG
ncbi:MAG TPA: VIT1/CCC1 family protein [Candidatus Limnocylindrales bacterium]|jgi:VIT1/CCC1 family predicted Fe2+/Mn2+ transporter